MEYTIKRIQEKNGNLVVEINHAFGISKFGFSLESRKLNPETDKPQFLALIEKHLELKFGDKNRKPKNVFSEYVGKKFVHKGINVPKLHGGKIW